MVYLVNFVLDITAGGLDDDHIALFFTYQSTCNRRAHRNHIALHIGLIFTHDAVSHSLVCAQVDEVNGGAKDHPARLGNSGDINDLDVAQLPLNLQDTTLGKALLITRRMILGILLEVTVCSRLCDSLHNARPIHLF